MGVAEEQNLLRLIFFFKLSGLRLKIREGVFSSFLLGFCFLFPFSRSTVHLYAYAREERKFPHKIPLPQDLESLRIRPLAVLFYFSLFSLGFIQFLMTHPHFFAFFEKPLDKVISK